MEMTCGMEALEAACCSKKLRCLFYLQDLISMQNAGSHFPKAPQSLKTVAIQISNGLLSLNKVVCSIEKPEQGRGKMEIDTETGSLVVGIARIAPVWLDRKLTLEKVVDYVDLAADRGCQLVVFGEALVPGYPFWIERTGGARFNHPVQKQLHAHYMRNAVQIEAGHLSFLCDKAAQRKIVVVAGCIERPADRGGHSLYAALVYINARGRSKRCINSMTTYGKAYARGA